MRNRFRNIRNFSKKFMVNPAAAGVYDFVVFMSGRWQWLGVDDSRGHLTCFFCSCKI